MSRDKMKNGIQVDSTIRNFVFSVLFYRNVHIESRS